MWADLITTENTWKLRCRSEKKHLTEAATAGVNCGDVDASVDFNADKHASVTYDR